MWALQIRSVWGRTGQDGHTLLAWCWPAPAEQTRLEAVLAGAWSSSVWGHSSVEPYWDY